MRIFKPAPSPVTLADRNDLQAALDAFPGANPTFEELRALLPAARRARFTDGQIAQAAADMGLIVQP